MKFILAFLLIISFNNCQFIIEKENKDDLPSGTCLKILVADAALIYSLVQDVENKNYSDIISKLPVLLKGLYNAYTNCFKDTNNSFYSLIVQDNNYLCVFNQLKNMVFNIILIIKDFFTHDYQKMREARKSIENEFQKMKQCVV